MTFLFSDKIFPEKSIATQSDPGFFGFSSDLKHNDLLKNQAVIRIRRKTPNLTDQDLGGSEPAYLGISEY